MNPSPRSLPDIATAPGATHEVINQPPPLSGVNAYSDDPILIAAIHRAGAEWIEDEARDMGELAGSEHAQRLAHEANRHPPELVSHDRYGHRIDEVAYHPAYHELMAQAFGRGLHSLAWTESRPGRFAARAALFYLWNQVENGVACPVTMSFAGRQVLQQNPVLAAQWMPKLLAREYDSRPLPLAQKRGITLGMAMTEKQGGSDLRANQTQADPVSADEFVLTGHKWFCSAPMSDGFFSLARTKAGVTCFFVPRSLPDGTRNRFLIQRLKDKCGNRSNASAEVEYQRTWAQRIGEEGRGIATLIEMAHLTRFDIVVATPGMMRAALVQALHHATHRSAFGRRLAEQPLMQNVLADLALEWEAAVLLSFRLARAFDRAQDDEREQHFARIVTPVAKYWLCKRAPAFTAEAMECLGGNGYVEEGVLSRLYREAPVNGIWEGSGNVICLDVLRSIARDPQSVGAILDEIEDAATQENGLVGYMAGLERELQDSNLIDFRARRLTEKLALALQASLMVKHAPPAVADAFCASRLGGQGGVAFGTLPPQTPFHAILERVRAS